MTPEKISPIPPDAPRHLVVANPDAPDANHIDIVGDTYTILLSGSDTTGCSSEVLALMKEGPATFTSSRTSIRARANHGAAYLHFKEERKPMRLPH